MVSVVDATTYTWPRMHTASNYCLTSHVTSSLSLQKLTTKTIYSRLNRLQWGHIYIPPSYPRQLVGNPPSWMQITWHRSKAKRREVVIPLAQQRLSNPKSIIQGILPRSSCYSKSTSNGAHKRICISRNKVYNQRRKQDCWLFPYTYIDISLN
jgi:hypothetical protein